VFKQAAHLTKQAVKIQAALEGINPLNAGRKRDEVVELLQRFFPDMEGLETRLHRYRREFDRQAKENADLQTRVDEAKPSMKDKLAQGNLLSEVNDLRRFYSAVPDNIRREVETALKQPHSRERG
jgi:hypothetical protein